MPQFANGQYIDNRKNYLQGRPPKSVYFVRSDTMLVSKCEKFIRQHTSFNQMRAELPMKDFTKRDSSFGKMFAEIGKLYGKKGDTESALYCFEQAIFRDFDEMSYYVLLAEQYIKSAEDELSADNLNTKTQSSAESFSSEQKTDTNSLSSEQKLSVSESVSMKLKLAADNLNKALELDETGYEPVGMWRDFRNYFNFDRRKLISEKLSIYKSALKSFDKLLELENKTPDFPLKYIETGAIYANKGLVYMEIGNNQSAEDSFEEAVKMNTSNPFAYIVLGMMHSDKGNFEKAEELIIKAAEMCPNAVYPKLRLCQVYIKQKKYTEARKVCEDALKIDKDDDILYYSLGIIDIETGENSKAIKNLNKAIQLQPGNVQAHTALGKAYFNIKKYSNSLQAYQNALQIDAYCDEAICNVKKIKEIKKNEKSTKKQKVR